MRYPEQSSSTIAALVGRSIWEPDSPLDTHGRLTATSNPWLKKYFDDLDALAKINASFRKVWQAIAWNAVYTDDFLEAPLAAIQSYHDPPKRSIRVQKSHITFPGMQKLKPYSLFTLHGSVDECA